MVHAQVGMLDLISHIQVVAHVMMSCLIVHTQEVMYDLIMHSQAIVHRKVVMSYWIAYRWSGCALTSNGVWFNSPQIHRRVETQPILGTNLMLILSELPCNNEVKVPDSEMHRPTKIDEEEEKELVCSLSRHPRKRVQSYGCYDNDPKVSEGNHEAVEGICAYCGLFISLGIYVFERNESLSCF